MSESKELTEVEHVKQASRHLRGTLEEGLFSEESGFAKGDQHLMKFHGFYQQKNRELPKETAFHSFMLRGRIPGGRLTADQYLAWDELATQYGGGSLRITTRQALQLHGVLKGDLKATIQGIRQMGLTTLGACGDVVRNVTQAANLTGDPALAQLDGLAELLSDHFAWKSRAYAEIWLDEEKLEEPQEPEPLYGATYLPRKFKMAVTLAGRNDIDIYTNDLAYAATLGQDGVIDGAFILGGGGMGMTHGKPETFPRAADLLGWVPASHFLTVAEALVAVHREFGDRTDRKHARLKYVFAEQGLAWVREQVEHRAGVKFDPRPLPPWQTPSTLGWQRRSDGTWAFGLHILCGRVIDAEGSPIRTALHEVVARFRPDVVLTADQGMALLGISDADRGPIEASFKAHGLDFLSSSPLRDRALACVSLPTCGLAVTESERVLDPVLTLLEGELTALNLLDRAPVVRMTGCPNGCARPYAAEIGIVGQAKNRHAIFVGGHHEGSRLNRLWLQKVPLEELGTALRPLLRTWAERSNPTQRLGEWLATQDWELLRAELEIQG